MATSTARRFRDRTEAGRLLAEELRQYAGRDDVVVFGLPRGGVPVAFEVAQALDAPLDVFLVRKLGVPGHEELAFGAIATGGTRVLHKRVVETLDLPSEWIQRTGGEGRRQRYGATARSRQAGGRDAWLTVWVDRGDRREGAPRARASRACLSWRPAA